ncbi:MAG: 4a-hydroxytetrahydrobiopterin dehydratase [Deltaproteobacteria bacterium]|nr:4a-hydroxytetrahydrobiopterin dehydratase [Deltaproteobacteria bacterium]MBW2400525.1 4a-hydroxytetrahydrobiopterin dehydratase [Deltaproteobacteria bacterium]MBW2664779.1 4a-hydroxytetrahydrobiopterin dehydratase [Deltaproteobacteria bacterium]
MPTAKKLTDREVAEAIARLPGWRVANDKLHRELVFEDFKAAFAFMTRVAVLAEDRDHHPDWSNVYNRVTIDLETHDAGGITEKDCDLATAIERLLESA